jgi:hypothetical protein
MTAGSIDSAVDIAVGLCEGDVLLNAACPDPAFAGLLNAADQDGRDIPDRLAQSSGYLVDIQRFSVGRAGAKNSMSSCVTRSGSS